MTLIQKLLVVGGNGFLGSAVCKAALAKGMQVTSISSSGQPYRTPKGHTPDWVNKVNWQTANALHPESYAHHMLSVTAVVHTLGTLFEDQQYKQAIKEGNLPALLSTAFRNLGTKNPLADVEKNKSGSYEVMNRDSALRVCETFLSTPVPSNLERPRAFVYVSAEDIFRPWISEKYIEMKREAESRIDEMISNDMRCRSVHIRPSLMYHPHLRPITSPLATVIDLSANIHSLIPRNLPTPAGMLRSLSGLSAEAKSPFDSMANGLTIHPIHVEHVANAIVLAADVERTDIEGVQGVKEMREMLGYDKTALLSNVPGRSSHPSAIN